MMIHKSNFYVAMILPMCLCVEKILRVGWDIGKKADGWMEGWKIGILE